MKKTMEEAKVRIFEIFIGSGFTNDNTDSALTLYHYTSAENALKIIESEEFWLRHPSTMNDFREVQHGFEIINNILKSSELSLTFEWIEKTHGLMLKNYVMRAYEKLLENVGDNVYLACFTKHQSQDEDEFGRLSMWRAYGSGANKTALRLDLRHASSQTGLILVPAIYEETDKIKVYIIEKLKEMASLINDLGDNIKEVEVIILLLATLFVLLAISLKHKGFSEEKEWRLIYLPEASAIKDFISDEIKTIQGIPQRTIVVPLKPEFNGRDNPLKISNVLTGVLIGPTPFTTAIGDAFSRKMTEKGLKDSSQLIKFSNIPLR